MNKPNRCAHLWNIDTPELQNQLKDIFDIQLSLQQRLSENGRGLDYTAANFKTRVNDISAQWRNLTLEFAELMERLPFKEWKTYNREERAGFMTEEQKLETWYEYADMFHFFINIGLALGINGDTLVKLYLTKNDENLKRQNRGY